MARAPGRVNLIGEHTDYNDGFVLPMALPFDTVVAASPAPSEAIAIDIASEGFGRFELPLADLETDVLDWAPHLAGVVRLLAGLGVGPVAWRGAIASDIPIGASLSSSAALEVAAISCMLHLTGVSRAAGGAGEASAVGDGDDAGWGPIEIARLGQRVENEVVGLPSGIMDQLISAAGVAGSALLIDCRSLALTPCPLPDGVSVAVMDTGTRRRLAGGAYADRKAACERVAARLGVAALRDADVGDLDRLPADMAVERRRAAHVITENQRVLDTVDALSAGDPVAAGELMAASHASLRDDYEVSGPALDRVVEAASGAPGCFGARMTGGGFAGCAVALVASDEDDAFRHAVTARYPDDPDHEDDHAPVIWICEPSVGASVEQLGPSAPPDLLEC